MRGSVAPLPGIRRAKRRRIIERSGGSDAGGARIAGRVGCGEGQAAGDHSMAPRGLEAAAKLARKADGDQALAWRREAKSPIIYAFLPRRRGETMAAYQHVKVPTGGQKITVNKDCSLVVPDQPIVPYIEGDGTGVDITPVMIKVVDAAVAKAYGGRRKIHWMEIYAGEKSTHVYGADVWLPDETLDIVKDYVISIK